jgi:hypothetical protein
MFPDALQLAGMTRQHGAPKNQHKSSRLHDSHRRSRDPEDIPAEEQTEQRNNQRERLQQQIHHSDTTKTPSTASCGAGDHVQPTNPLKVT